MEMKGQSTETCAKGFQAKQRTKGLLAGQQPNAEMVTKATLLAFK